jgi:chorismate mutase
MLLIRRRLETAREVAMAKRNSGAPVEDLEREKQVLQSVESMAKDLRVDPATANRFFQAQIDANKMAQNSFLEEWRSRPPFATVPDLQKTIRPRLDALTPALLLALRDIGRPSAESIKEAARRNAIKGLYEKNYREAWKKAVSPLLVPPPALTGR